MTVTVTDGSLKSILISNESKRSRRESKVPSLIFNSSFIFPTFQNPVILTRLYERFIKKFLTNLLELIISFGSLNDFSGYFEVVGRPAKFRLSDLEVDPENPVPMDTVTVSCVVMNTGDSRGVKTLTFRVDGRNVSTKSVPVSAGSSRTVEFETTAEIAGQTHSVSINELEGEFMVQGVGKFEEEEKKVEETTGSPIWALSALVVGLAALGAAAVGLEVKSGS